jgi:hypothetical protein
MELTSVTPVTCKNCGNRFIGKYCNQCGEKVYTEHDRTALHFFEEGFHFLTHFEGTFFTTIKTLFSKPGQVSVDYSYGIRKRYFKLLSLFLLLVVLYLLFPVFEGLNMKLYYHTHNNLYSGYAMRKTQEVMREKNWTDAQVTEAFHKTSEKVSKFLLLILIPCTALLLWAVSFKKRKYFFDQMVFATELNCMYLIWGFLLLPLLLIISQWTYHLFTRTYFYFSDDYSFFFSVIPIGFFVVLASRRFYGFKMGRAVLFSLYFLIVHTFIVHYLYKFVLFATVINQIH